MIKYQYPCTENISLNGFGEYLEHEIGMPRRNIQMFANELNTTFGTSFLTLTNSGSSANLVAALAMAEKIKYANKPMTAVASGFTFPTTISALLMAGFEVKLIDVEPEGFNLSVDRLMDEPVPPSLIALTHFLGFPCDMNRICEYAHNKGALILQDACETLNLTTSNGIPYFSLGDITTWSFYHPHHLSSYGGGAVITLNQEDFILSDSIAHWGRACKCHIDERLCSVPDGPAHQFTYERLGVNVEMSELNACFGRWQLRNWSIIEEKRKQNYAILYNRLKDCPNLKVWAMPRIGGSPFVFPVMLRNGMTIYDAYRILSAQGIEIRTLMGGATCKQEAYLGKITFDDQMNTLAMTDKTFFVGIHHTLSSENVEFVADAIAGV